MPQTNSPRNKHLATVILIAATLACLLPFIGKAFHIDDPLFIWAAKAIRSHPLNPYGFTVNWYGTNDPMYQVTQNPPLGCYYIALASVFVGWSEAGIHAFMLIPAIMAILGTYQLARRLCSAPFMAALLALLTPVFLVSASTVMCDVPMLAFWVWAIVFWLRGLDENRKRYLLISALLIAAAAMSKYYGATLIVLLPAYSLLKKRRLGWWAAYLLIPVGIMALYQWATFAIYGKGLLTGAAGYANAFRFSYETRLADKVLIGLGFTGGCLLPVLFYAPLVWSRRVLASGLVLSGAIVLYVVHMGLGSFTFHNEAGSVLWSPVVHLAVFALSGLAMVALAFVQPIKRRDPETILLGMWAISTILFASLINWSINGRSILPAVPAMAILLVNAIESRHKLGEQAKRWFYLIPLVPAAALAIWVCHGDYVLANSWRDCAKAVCARYNSASGTVYVEGHWGFQYYAEEAGAVSIDKSNCALEKGDVTVLVRFNTNWFDLPAGPITPEHAMTTPVRCGIATMAPVEEYAGFYSEGFGPLPFCIGRASDLEVYPGMVNQPLILRVSN